MMKSGSRAEVMQDLNLRSQIEDLEAEIRRAELLSSGQRLLVRRLVQALSYDDVMMGLSEAEVIESEVAKLCAWCRLVRDMQTHLSNLKNQLSAHQSAHTERLLRDPIEVTAEDGDEIPLTM